MQQFLAVQHQLEAQYINLAKLERQREYLLPIEYRA